MHRLALFGARALAVQRTCYWFDRLIRQQASGPCVIRSAVLFRSMTAHGHQVEWVFGFRKTAAGNPLGHAWVEQNGAPIPVFGDELASQAYVETYRSGPQPATPIGPTR